ncbi:hypothetical protein V8C34DRAFT_279478 [Trichoderma compactum]
MYVPLFSFFLGLFFFFFFFFIFFPFPPLCLWRCGKTTSLHLRYGVPIKEKTTVSPRKM